MKNQTIALLMGIFIVISLASFLIYPRNIVYITGKASSGQGYTSFNMSEEVSILVTNSVDFGAGRVDANASFAILDSELGTGGGLTYNFSWQNVTGISGSPVGRDHGGLVYDKNSHVFIYYGGIYIDGGDTITSNETWEFNYSNKQWTNITSTAGSPDILFDFGTAYDSSTGEAIIFGGYNGPPLNETWKFNSSGVWQNMSPSEEVPPPLSRFSMAFDSRRNVVVLFGGEYSIYKDETWEYNVSANTWAKKTVSIKPPALVRASMAFDSDRNVTVLFGGQTGSLSLSNETWGYDGTNWTNVTAFVGPSPNVRYSAGMVYDPLRKKIVLSGGSGGGYGMFNDTWTYDGASWSQDQNGYFINPKSALNNMVFDPDLNSSFIIFGSDYVSSAAFNDVLEYNYTTSGTGYNGSGGCINGTWAFSPGYIYVENDGTVNISINYTANNNAVAFIGGTSPSFKIKGVVNETGACPSLDTAYAEVSNSTGTPNTLCPLLKYQNDADRFQVPARLVVPSDVASGEHNSTITFSATLV